jgi:hypothetical protein
MAKHPREFHACPSSSQPTFTGVQYQGTAEDYDGISEYNCDACGGRWGRWTGRVLGRNEIEPRYGRQEAPK